LQTLFWQTSVVQGLLSLGQVQGAIQELVLNWQLEHFNVPVYPVPNTLKQVAPPKAVPSHFSVPSRTLLPQTAEQSLSFV
jgi:hypothetical protein